jgi:hypothetical protein
MERLKIYMFDTTTFFYIGEDWAYPDPMDPNNYLIPSNGTATPPPKVDKDQVAYYDPIAQGWGVKAKPKQTTLLTSQSSQLSLQEQAKQILSTNDFRWSNPIKWNSYTDEERQKLTNFYQQLVDVVNGKSKTIPILNF